MSTPLPQSQKADTDIQQTTSMLDEMLQDDKMKTGINRDGRFRSVAQLLEPARARRR